MNEPNSTKSKKKKVIFGVLMVLIIIALPLIVGEILVRSLYEYQTPETLYRESIDYEPSIIAHAILPQKNRVIQKKEGKKTIVYNINKHGYRGREFDAIKEKGIIRIIFLGGSHVFDTGATKGEDWPHLTGKYLKDDGFENVEVINAGIPGYMTYEALGILYSEIHNFQPDYVLVCNAWNDIKYFKSLSRKNTLLRMYKPISSKNPLIHYQSWLDKWLCSSQLYVRLRHRYYTSTMTDLGDRIQEIFQEVLSGGLQSPRKRIATEGFIPPEFDTSPSYGQFGIKQYELNLKTIVDVCRNIGAKPVLMTQARLVSEENSKEDKGKIVNYPRLEHKALVRAFNECDSIVRSVAKEKNAYLIDLSERFTGQSDLFNDHVHLTSKGSKAIAQYTSLELGKILKRNYITNSSELDN